MSQKIKQGCGQEIPEFNGVSWRAFFVCCHAFGWPGQFSPRRKEREKRQRGKRKKVSKPSICNRDLDPAWKIKVVSYLGGADTLGNPDRSSVLMFPAPDQISDWLFTGTWIKGMQGERGKEREREVFEMDWCTISNSKHLFFSLQAFLLKLTFHKWSIPCEMCVCVCSVVNWRLLDCCFSTDDVLPYHTPEGIYQSMNDEISSRLCYNYKTSNVCVCVFILVLWHFKDPLAQSGILHNSVMRT